MSLSKANSQLKARDARMCNAAEKRLLRSLLTVRPSQRDTLVIGTGEACQWLLKIGQPVAARQLSQHTQPQPQPQPQTADSKAARQRLSGTVPASERVGAAPTQLLPSQDRLSSGNNIQLQRSSPGTAAAEDARDPQTHAAAAAVYGHHEAAGPIAAEPEPRSDSAVAQLVAPSHDDTTDAHNEAGQRASTTTRPRRNHRPVRIRCRCAQVSGCQVTCRHL